jgi:hypothetical protein
MVGLAITSRPGGAVSRQRRLSLALGHRRRVRRLRSHNGLDSGSPHRSAPQLSPSSSAFGTRPGTTRRHMDVPLLPARCQIPSWQHAPGIDVAPIHSLDHIEVQGRFQIARAEPIGIEGEQRAVDLIVRLSLRDAELDHREGGGAVVAVLEERGVVTSSRCGLSHLGYTCASDRIG